jgi:hypothetical protein
MGRLEKLLLSLRICLITVASYDSAQVCEATVDPLKWFHCLLAIKRVGVYH